MAQDIRIRFGQRVRKLRKKAGLTQAEPTDKLGLDRSYLADIERGKRNASLPNLEIIAEGFGVTPRRLLSGL